MKAQHARMGNFEEAMVALGKAGSHEKDVPHKNVSRIKEFRAF